MGVVSNTGIQADCTAFLRASRVSFFPGNALHQNKERDRIQRGVWAVCHCVSPERYSVKNKKELLDSNTM